MIKTLLGDQETLFNNIQDNTIDCIVTDPPYNVLKHKIETNFNFNKFVENSFRVLKKGGFLVYFCQEPTATLWNFETMKKFNFVTEIIWNKNGGTNATARISKYHEKIMIFSKGKGDINRVKVDWVDEKEELIEFVNKQTLLKELATYKKFIKKSENIKELHTNLANYNFFGSNSTGGFWSHLKDSNTTNIRKVSDSYVDKRISTIWGCRPQNLEKTSQRIDHPTVKPITLVQRILKIVSNDGDLVLDTFLGSGTTALACILENRKFIGFEIHKEYFDLSNKRIKELK